MKGNVVFWNLASYNKTVNINNTFLLPSDSQRINNYNAIVFFYGINTFIQNKHRCCTGGKKRI